MTVTRDWLDRVLPEDAAMFDRASKLAGDVFDLEGQLDWLAKLVEADRFPRPAWAEGPRLRPMSDHVWPIEVDGVRYKSERQYLTLEGWPLGTRCWFVIVQCGFREAITASTAKAAVARAVIFVSHIRVWRNTDPAHRPTHYQSLIEVQSSAAEAEARIDAIRAKLA